MISAVRHAVLPLVLATAGCALGSGDEGTEENAPASPPSREPVDGFTPLPASAEFQSYMSAPALDRVDLPEGTYSLGYVPTPVTIPQSPVLIDTAGLPSTYDLRAQTKLTAVRDQGSCGACWAFATFASSESDLLPIETWDFSEDHLNNTHGFDIAPCAGGNSVMSMAYMSRWSGPVAESDAPYTGKAHTYSTQPTVRKHLTEAFVFPDRSGPLDNNVLKAAVSTYGAIYTTMYWDNAYWSGAANAYYKPAPATGSNHAVAIVGWDDDFPASSFATTPAGNGAFLIRNSWGTSFGDSGYFHISYYDANVGRENVSFEAFDVPTDYTAIYQWDKLGQTNALTFPSSTTYSANIFTSTAETNLEAVSFYTTQPSSDVRVSIYDAPTTSPTTGTLSGSQEASEAFAGYHTVIVPTLGVHLHKGRTFSVVVKVTTTQSSSYVPIEYPFAHYSSKVVAAAGHGFVGSDGSTWTDTGKTWKANVPIKAFAAAAPNCDDGNACTIDAWDGTACTHTNASAGTVCRAAVGTCDVAEVCDGSGAACPADVLVGSGTVCRASAGDCDVAETCTGKSGLCPVNAFVPIITVCRAVSGVCDAAEHCTGTSAACPADAKQKKGTVCRASTAPCDAAETCSGTTNDCPADMPSARGTICRASKGVCDVAETCDGSAMTCPSDSLAPSGTVCRASAGVCDVAETCSGSSVACPANRFVPSSVVCRAAAGACDIAESCTGTAAACPADAMHAKGYVCSSSPSTVTCTGKSKTCL